MKPRASDVVKTTAENVCCFQNHLLLYFCTGAAGFRACFFAADYAYCANVFSVIFRVQADLKLAVL